MEGCREWGYRRYVDVIIVEVRKQVFCGCLKFFIKVWKKKFVKREGCEFGDVFYYGDFKKEKINFY